MLIKLFVLILFSAFLAMGGNGKTQFKYNVRQRSVADVKRSVMLASKDDIPKNPEKMIDFLEFMEFFDEYGEIIDVEVN